MKLARLGFWGLVILIISFLALLGLQDLYNPALFLFKSFAFQVSIFFVLLASFVAFFVRKNMYVLLVALAINLALGVVILSQYAFHSMPGKESPQFRVTTFSALGRTRNGQDILSYVQTSQPEVLCLQEVTLEDTLGLDHYYEYIYQPGNDDLAIASVWPIHAITTQLGLQQAEIETTFGALMVTNVHMPRQYQQKGVSEPWRELMRSSLKIGESSILCGDFNMTPYSSMYTQITKKIGYEDAHEKSWGLNFTFPHKQRRIALFGPQFRIDYIFTKHLKTVWSETFGLSDLSDHRAVMATIEWIEK